MYMIVVARKFIHDHSTLSIIIQCIFMHSCSRRLNESLWIELLICWETEGEKERLTDVKLALLFPQLSKITGIHLIVIRKLR